MNFVNYFFSLVSDNFIWKSWKKTFKTINQLMFRGTPCMCKMFRAGNYCIVDIEINA